MGLVILLIVLALICGGVGLAFDALRFLLIFAVVAIALSILTGIFGRRNV